jgi:hypothetical protein
LHQAAFVRERACHSLGPIGKLARRPIPGGGGSMPLNPPGSRRRPGRRRWCASCGRTTRASSVPRRCPSFVQV